MFHRAVTCLVHLIMQVDVDGVLLTRLGTVENRTHNRANEVQTTCTHDRNGNMTVMPGLRGVYDAWNRLAEVRNASNVLLATYAYNGLNQRVRKTAGNVVTTSFFNSAWQELESTTSNQTTLNIWGLRYIDDLVLREKVAERLYSLADPNWNVVATTNASGAVQERMRYDAFGRITWLNASFATKTNTDFAWNRTFTGQVLDSESGLMLYRNRYYHSGLGRFVNRDPIGYNAGDVSLYRYVGNMSHGKLDPMGLALFPNSWFPCGECTPKDPPETTLEFSGPFPGTGNPKNLDWGHNIQNLGDTATIVQGGTAIVTQGIPHATATAGATVTTPRPRREPGTGFSGVNNPGGKQGAQFYLWVRVTRTTCEWCCPKWRGGYFDTTFSYFQCESSSSDNPSRAWTRPATAAEMKACMDAAKKANPEDGDAAKEQKAYV